MVFPEVLVIVLSASQPSEVIAGVKEIFGGRIKGSKFITHENI
jgi:hypothetical protein